jgi:NaMN:DMB phosphoribosyltransferase
MLAVYALAQALVKQQSLEWQPQQIVVGTTRWVAEDMTGDTPGLAGDIGSVTLLASKLSFATSRYPQLQAYEQGYVKEGVGAGGCAIAAHLYQCWNQIQLLQAIEVLSARYSLS